MKDWLKKITGIAAKEQALQAEREKITAENESRIKQLEEQELELLKKKDPKEYATRKKEPWVGVLNTHVNKENIRNGFFELDWNEYFVLQLRQEGYGTDGDPEEEIVDRWFRELCANVVVDGDYGGPVNTGVIDIQSVKRKNQ
jgi:hypothetical protein